MIPFNKPCITGKEKKYLDEVFTKKKFSGDGYFTKKCNNFLEQRLNSRKALLTSSCTHALEMAAILIDISPGDEVIMTSYTFVSTANAFVLRGAKVVFVDIDPNTMNIDEKIIKEAITEKTKAIIPVHYAGIACDMDTIMKIASEYGLYVIEDAAQAIMSKYKNQYLGTIGHLGCFSFHETKNIQCGEGGALLINDESFIEKAEIIREKGTNRSKFFRGEIDKYTWVEIGSSYLPSEINAAFLLSQLENADEIIEQRLYCWTEYYNRLFSLLEKNLFELPTVPDYASHNAHLFYIKCKSLSERTSLIEYLQRLGINAVFHYVPLHSSPAGKKYARFNDVDFFTTTESEKLLRLPMFYDLKKSEIKYICDSIGSYFK